MNKSPLSPSYLGVMGEEFGKSMKESDGPINCGDVRGCGICGAGASSVWRNYPGYQLSSTFDIFHCPNCDTSFAHPMKVNEHLYDLIYKNAEILPGYYLYVRMAHEVCHVPDPLKMLTSLSGRVWGINKCLESYPCPGQAKILEVGSGLGYLTYALRRKGYQAIGLDVSQEAVARARRRYGDYYMCSDLESFSARASASFDVVIMTEVIEHIPNVLESMRAAGEVLVPGGVIVVTTPNKSAYPTNALWVTDAPPVHFWWFSKLSAEVIGAKLGYLVRFVDLRESGVAESSLAGSLFDCSTPIHSAFLDRDGQCIYQWSFSDLMRMRIGNKLAQFGLWSSAYRFGLRMRRQQTTIHRKTEPEILCAIMEKPKAGDGAQRNKQRPISRIEPTF